MMTRAIVVGLVCAANAAASAQTMYSVRETDDTLVRIDITDPDSPAFNDVGPLGVLFDFGGMSFGPDNELFMLDGRGDLSLYTVDTMTGAAEFIGHHGLDFDAIAWDSSTRTMYATQYVGNEGLYTLDPKTGEATVINPRMDIGIGGLTYNADTDQLIGSANGPGDLYEVDRDTGDLTLLFDGPFVDDSGLTYDPINNFYWGIDWSGVLFRYDIDAGFARTDVRSGLDPHDGLAWTVPAPCPADLDGSGSVDFGDILAILSAWGNKGGPEDLDESGFVDFGDLLIVLAAWGPCP